jgi:hypothetical protein
MHQKLPIYVIKININIIYYFVLLSMIQKNILLRSLKMFSNEKNYESCNSETLLSTPIKDLLFTYMKNSTKYLVITKYNTIHNYKY